MIDLIRTDIVWNTIQEDVPKLKKQIQATLENTEL